MNIKFLVLINSKPFKIDRYTNLACFGNLLFKGIIDLKKAIGDQRKISEIVNELEKNFISEEVVHLAKKIEMILKI